MVTSPEKLVTSLSDKEISELFQDAYHKFWKKWRGNVPAQGSDNWDELVKKDVYSLLEKYHHDEQAKIIIFWFMDQLDARSKAMVAIR